MLIAILGCTVDYGMGEMYPFTPEPPPSAPVDVAAPAVEGDLDGDPSTLEVLAPGDQVQLLFNIWYEEGDWGERTSTCMLQLGFFAQGEPVEVDEQADEGQVISYPTEPGACAYTSLSGEDQAMGEPAVTSSYDAGEFVYLDGADESWALERFEDQGSGAIFYELADCGYEGFPFGELLTLDVPGGEEAELEPFVVEEVIAVGPAVHLDRPDNAGGDDNVLDWDQDDGLKVGWHFGQDAPEVEGEEIDGAIYLMVRNQDAETMELLEALACMPGEGDRFEIGSAELHQLAANPSLDEQVYQVAFQIDTWYTGPRFETPWGEHTEVRSVFTTGGLMNLYE